MDARLVGCLAVAVGTLAAGCGSGASDERIAAEPRPWTVVTLPTAGRLFTPIAVNARGQIAGVIDVGESNGDCCWGAALWADGRLAELPGLGGYESRPESIDERGRVVGWSQVAPAADEPLPTGPEPPPGEHHGVLWESGRVHDLGRGFAHLVTDSGAIFGSFDGTTSGADVIDLPFEVTAAANRRGHVVGWTSRPTADSARGETVVTAYLWTRGRVTRLATLPGFESSRADDINDRGQIAGVAMLASGAVHLVRWDDGRMRDLGVVAEDWYDDVGSAHINEAGDVAVWSSDLLGEASAFLATRGELRRLPEQLHSVADLDDEGRVLGSGFVRGATRGYVWQDGKLTELPIPPSLLLEPGQSRRVDPRMFTERGEIVGTVDGRAVVWRQVEARH